MEIQNETRYKSDVFDAILFFASEDGKKRLLSKGKFILLEMIAATTEYLDGDTDKIITPEQTYFVDNWTGMVNQAIKQALEKNTKRLNPAMVKAMISLLTIELEYEHGESWQQSGVETMLMFRQRGMSRTFFFTVPEAQQVKDKIQKILDADTIKHCEQIGILMRKYIERDLMVFD